MEKDNWSLALVTEEKNALSIFTKGNVDKLVEELEKEVRSIASDVSTAKGRKEIASLAHKDSRSKTALDALGKDLVGEWKAKSKAVDSERKHIRDRLDALRDEVRTPLTEWEDAEKERIEKKRLDKEKLDSHEQALIENDLFNRRKDIERKEEMQRKTELKRIEKEKEEESKRLAKQKAETEEKARIEREAKIKRDAETAAKKEAEEKAELYKKEAEQRIIDAKVAEQRAKQEKIDIENRAKQEKIEAEQRKDKELKEQEDRLRREQQQKEQDRINAEAKAKAEDDRRAANINYQKTINNGILKDLLSIGISNEHAKKLITMIAKKQIENIKITY